MRTWAKTIESRKKKMKILFVRGSGAFFCVVFGFQRSSIPNKTQSQACSRKNSEKMVALFTPLVYKTVPKKFASETIRIAQAALRREKLLLHLSGKSRTRILPCEEEEEHYYLSWSLGRLGSVGGWSRSTARGQMSRSKNLERKRWMPPLLHLSGRIRGAAPRRS